MMDGAAQRSNGAHLARRSVLLAAAIGLFGARHLHAALPAPASATDFIKNLGDRTVAILRTSAPDNQKLGELKKLLDQSTDLALVARLVMGRYWRQASEAQRQEYLKLFNALLMQNMAERFSWYTGETFQITDSKPVDERDTMVSTLIIRPPSSGKPPIKVDWRVRNAEGRYLLIDIVAEGITLVVSQRSEAAEFIDRNGIEGLLQEMRDRLAKRDAAKG